MRTQTLDKMVSMLRAECGESTNASQGINSVEGSYQLLRRTQEELYDEFNWPQFIIDTDEAIQIGENYYTFNDAIDPMRIFNVWVKDNDIWRVLPHGITPIDYNSSDPEDGGSETVPLKWQMREDNQFEVWPMPSATSTIRFRHTKTLQPMTAGTSSGTLDANLLVLFAAAERMASKKDQGAPIKLQKANKRLNALRGASSQMKVFSNVKPIETGRSLPQDWSVRAPR